MRIRGLPVSCRPREKALRKGIESLDDAELLALILTRLVTALPEDRYAASKANLGLSTRLTEMVLRTEENLFSTTRDIVYENDRIGVDDGDLVIVRQQSACRDGDYAVVLVDGRETLLKTVTYLPDSHAWLLHAENPDYPDRIEKDVRIQGVAVKVIKTLTY